MPTIMTHAVVPLAMAVAAGRSRIAPRVMMAGCVLAMLPDADVIGFKFGIAYADQWGHRGASHALILACGAMAVVMMMMRPHHAGWAAAFLLVSAASHGLLDALTSGGLGPALFWPWTQDRIFFPFRPIRVSPIGADFLSMRGLETLESEALWVWLPCLALAGGAFLIRRVQASAASGRDSGQGHQSPD